MKEFRFILWTLLSVAIITISCNEKEELISAYEESSEYFPTTIGHANEYLVTEITYLDNGQKIDTLKYFLKDEFVSSYFDNQGQEFHIIDRYKRFQNNSEWQYDQSQRATIFDNQAIISEGALQFVKLQLPVNTGREWNGNQYFDDNIMVNIAGQTIAYYKNWQSKYLAFDPSMDISGRRYSDVLTVQIADHENKLEKRFGQELYAAGIGLIYKELIILDTQCFDDCPSIRWEEKAQKGQIFIQQYINSN